MTEYIFPFRNIVVHPGLTVPMYVDTPASIACIEKAATTTQQIVLTPQHSAAYPTAVKDLFDCGTLCHISQVMRMPDGAMHVVVQSIDIVKLSDIKVNDGVFTGTTTVVPITDDMNAEQIWALRDRIREILQHLGGARKYKIDKFYNVIAKYPLPAFIDAVLEPLDLDADETVKILMATTWYEKVVLLLAQVKLMAETVKIEDTISRRVQQQMESGRREAILQEKMRAIQEELGDTDDDTNMTSLRKRIEDANLPKPVQDKAMSELRRMRSMPPMSNESGLVKTYLDELLAMPWGKSDKSEIDLKSARQILDSEHSAMASVKERILEHIAVMKKTGNNRGSILCFVGAPGVGKTSLCKSIAKALGRKYHRISLGGISDEAHFRGHRRTYIGSQPGRIMDALKRCGADNPVIVLDEIDKMGRDWRGDPESALLEILDPEQNKYFRDHYLEVDFDLSNVMFIATANTLNLSNALKDRMEIIELPGYSEDEKLQIAREHLIARAATDTGWNVDNIQISDDAIRHIIRNYTSEQGVRQLQRELTAILRRSLLENDGEDIKTNFTTKKINELLAVHKNATPNHRIGFSASV